MDALAPVLAGAVGLAFGSFLGVVVHRVPRRESVVAPRSRCPACGRRLPASENVPVLSYVLLRGRCRGCGARISLRYPAGEFLTGLLWALAVVRTGVGWHLVVFLPFLWVLVALSLIDLEHRILPNRIVYPALAAGPGLVAVAAAGGGGAGAFVRSLLAAAAAGGAFLVIALVSPAGMGMGDVKLAALIGMALGLVSWGHVILAFFLAFLAGAAVGVGLIAAGRAGRKTAIPFGPFLALGAALSLLFGGPILGAWRA
jgi:leader peptidase (prepilin peptidase)/N-methyltransferase